MKTLNVKTKILAISVLSFIILIISCENKPTNPIDEIINEGDDTVEPILAADMIEQVDSLALTYDQSLCLAQVKSDNVALDGTSGSWQYCYIGEVSMDYHFFAIENNVSLDSLTDPIFGPMVIFHNWINSDSAIIIADENGGKTYRENLSDYKISAVLNGALDSVYWSITYSSIESNDDFNIHINGTDTNILSSLKIEYIGATAYSDATQPSGSDDLRLLLMFEVENTGNQRVLADLTFENEAIFRADSTFLDSIAIGMCDYIAIIPGCIDTVLAYKAICYSDEFDISCYEDFYIEFDIIYGNNTKEVSTDLIYYDCDYSGSNE